MSSTSNMFQHGTPQKAPKGISRRTFLQGAGALGACAFGAGLAGCSSGSDPSFSRQRHANGFPYPDMIAPEDLAASAAITEPITDFSDEDLRHLGRGRGVAGVPAVLTALDEGFRSAACKGIASSPNGAPYSWGIVEACSWLLNLRWQHYVRANNSYRVNWDLLDFSARWGLRLLLLDKQAGPDRPAGR